jgi:ketosteroid isomerase-like protein
VSETHLLETVEVSMSKIRALFAIILLCPLAGAVLAGDYADDRAEIMNLSNRYMVAVDAGDIETVMSTWAEDGVLEWIGGVERGAAEIREAMSNFGGARKVEIPEAATSRPRTRHQIINHVIDVDGDTAKTIAYWFAMTNNTPQKDVQIMYMGHYEDELVKLDGHWRFKHRKVYNESLENRAVFYPGLGEKDPRTR